MKALFVIQVLAILLATGCTSGSRGKTVNVIEPTPVLEAEAPPAEIVAPVEVIVVAPKEQPTTNDSRIDAVSFLDALVKSGCEIDKAEYKEVIRGGGIVVTCKGNVDPLELDGLEGL